VRVAYATPSSCGLGHAVRGAGLVEAGLKAGVEVRAFGPPMDRGPWGYEGTLDWKDRLRAWRPDLLLGDIMWISLRDLVATLDSPGWLLVRSMRPDWLVDPYGLGVARWERRISIEPAADDLPGITHRVPPIVGPDRWRPLDGSEVRAGYNAWWESILYDWHDRVRWTADGSPERQARIDAGPVPTTVNGADALMAMIQ